jgi:hypothetical protein
MLGNYDNSTDSDCSVYELWASIPKSTSVTSYTRSEMVDGLLRTRGRCRCSPGRRHGARTPNTTASVCCRERAQSRECFTVLLRVRKVSSSYTSNGPNMLMTTLRYSEDRRDCPLRCARTCPNGDRNQCSCLDD